MKNMIRIFILIVAAAVFYSCTKSKDFIADNTTPTGVGYRPVSTNPLRDLAAAANLDGRSYTVGSSFTTEIQFFSESPVKEINLYTTIGTGARTKIGTWPYAAAFSQVKRMDTLLVTYTMPAAPVTTKIKLEYEILNQNALNLIRTATVTVK
jgi:hypothetical protein